MPDQRETLRNIRTFPQLIKFLRDDLDWPIESDDFEELTFDYTPEELGIDSESAAKIQEIKRLRPLSSNQPWGIFFVKFEPKRLPVVALRRVLSRVVLKKRASANSAERAAWQADDLLFISNYGQGDERQISFAHFSTHEEKAEFPTLMVLGWDSGNTALHLDDVADKLTTRLSWPQQGEDAEHWRERWRSAFTLRHREVITTSKALAERLADLAQSIRKRVNAVLKIESEKGELRKLHVAFREVLIHDLSEDDFADMYAQTIAYGLLTARVSRPSGLVADNLRDMVPVTNPFLKDLLDSFLAVGGRKGKVDFDELGVSEVVQLLRDADMEAVLRDFGDRNPEEDPAIHFYELFLKEYDPKKRMQRGVFYTPRPVVSYIVRSVHELLQTEFGLEAGLASTITWGEMAKLHKDLKIPDGVAPESPFVQILDPATGTATFLVEVIDVIHRTLAAQWKQRRLTEAQQRTEWNQYVPKHLLPRIHGYELMMAPYAIAHMKIGLKLYETGYRFGSDERARIYLTNTLEPPSGEKKQREFEEWAPALAHEAQAVNAIKRHQRFTVVIGNPPYSGISSNMSDEAQQLVDRYRYVNGEPLGERKVWLQNDYVKFLGFAHRTLLNTGVGCLGFITDNSYLDGPTFRGVRSNLLQDFFRLHVLNLHGSAKKMNEAPAAEADQNVFDITQAVAVLLSVRFPGQKHQFCTSDLFGTRQSKYERLFRLGVGSVAWTKLTPSAPFFQFVATNRDGEAEYQDFYSIKTAFPLQSVGIQTSRDDLAIDFTRRELAAKIRDFASPKASDAEIRDRYFPGKKVADYPAGDTRSWSLSKARKELSKVKNLEGEIVAIHYRPFDFRYVFNSTLLVDWPRPEVSEQMYSGKNLGLCLLRRTENAREYDYFSVSRHTISNHQVSLKDGTYLSPLYLESGGDREGMFGHVKDRRPNLSNSFLNVLAAKLQLAPKGEHGLPAGITPEDIFHYAYAVFYSPGYRSRYAEFLKVDSPRLPLTGNQKMFRALARLGDDLVSIHLLESPRLDKSITTYTGPVNPEVEKISHVRDAVWLDKAATKGFQGVSESVWEFNIGGYQVSQKWLKDRKGRTLSKDDIASYQKIVVALSETIHLMSEIEKVISAYGGWPDAFKTSQP